MIRKKPNTVTLTRPEQFDEMLMAIRERTEDLRKMICPKERIRQKEKLSRKAAAVLGHITRTEQRIQVHLAGICSELLGENLIPYVEVNSTEETLNLPNWSCVIPLTNENSHNYEIGVPTIVNNIDVCIKSGWFTGNHIDNKKSALRPATDEEIITFVSTVAKNHGIEWKGAGL